ncbi:MAG: molybdenum cofactor biosynthesis protein MoaE [Gammaproteobacteria bacterium]
MSHFGFSREALTPERYRELVADPVAGGYASFEGWVRNHNDGLNVARLEYEGYEALGVKEGERVVAEAMQRFPVARAHCIHRLGLLEIGDLAVWVGVTAAHRDAAFAACRYIIDEIKVRVPIWKKEHYATGDSGWINCEIAAVPRCAPERTGAK